MKLISSLYLSSRFFLISVGIAVMFFISYYYDFLFVVTKITLLCLVVITILDAIAVLRKERIRGERILPEKFSNGDENLVQVQIENRYSFTAKTVIIDELPFQFQERKFRKTITLEPGKKEIIDYLVKPVKRGEYSFGSINVYPYSPIGLVSKRYKLETGRMVPVYPSYIQMRKYELFAATNRLDELGIKKNRRIGHTLEFEQIKNYVPGDDYRTINWKATARKAGLMVNQYQDEKSQQVYCAIDMGRVMKMSFDGMTLLDYAINTSLVLSNIAINKKDKAGIVTFSKDIHNLLPAESRYTHMQKILELLYNQETGFPESNIELLCAYLNHKIKHRSLVILFTNFETLSALKRQMFYLRKLASRHLLLLVFFENTELKKLISCDSKSAGQIYIKTIAEKFDYEKRQITRELNRHGIPNILSTPDELSINTINKYLELKAKGMI